MGSSGAHPFARADYIKKFEILTEGLVAPAESKRFLDLVQRLPDLTPTEVALLNVALERSTLTRAGRDGRGIF